MKRIVIILAGLFLLASCNNAGDKSSEKKVKYSDLANDNLKGDIETCYIIFIDKGNTGMGEN